MSDFTAGNGITVSVTAGGMGVGPYAGPLEFHGSPREIQAFREFFQHDADVRLGRWRDPERPSFVVYPQGDAGIVVLCETTGISRLFTDRGDVDGFQQSYLSPSAYAFLDAHPELKPWDAAEPGEYWMLTTGDGETRLYKMTDAGWRHEGKKHTPLDRRNRGGITAARRIWPTEDAS